MEPVHSASTIFQEVAKIVALRYNLQLTELLMNMQPILNMESKNTDTELKTVESESTVESKNMESKNIELKTAESKNVEMELKNEKVQSSTKCENCNKSFKTKDYLRRHMKRKICR